MVELVVTATAGPPRSRSVSGLTTVGVWNGWNLPSVRHLNGAVALRPARAGEPRTASRREVWTYPMVAALSRSVLVDSGEFVFECVGAGDEQCHGSFELFSYAQVFQRQGVFEQRDTVHDRRTADDRRAREFEEPA